MLLEPLCSITVLAGGLFRMNESIHGETIPSEPQDRVIELVEQQTAISDVLRAIANSPHDLQPTFDAILDSATRLCRADVGTLRLSEEDGLRRVAMRGDPLFVSQTSSSIPDLAEKESFLSLLAKNSVPTHVPDMTALEGDLRDDLFIKNVNAGILSSLFVPLHVDSEMVGIISLGRKHVQPFTDQQISLFRDFAAQAAIALESTRRERQYREGLRQIIETVPALLWSTGPDGEPTHISQRVLDYSGLRLEDFRHGGWEAFMHPADFPETAKAFYHAIQTGTAYQAVHRLRRAADGEYRWHHARGEPLRDREGRIVQWYGLSIDIDERKRAEQALREEQDRLRQLEADLAHMNRLSMMGELAASLAHEIAQPIATARNNARAALNFSNRSSTDQGEVKEALAAVVDDADRAGEILDRIRDHIKKAPARKEIVDLNAAILEVTALTYSEAVKTGVTVGTQLAAELPRIRCDRVQLQQVMLNLIVNAIQSMSGLEDGNRELHISTASIEPEGVCVAVRDTGHGLRPESLPRLFEPFYTTKPNGMGMGLSICRSIIEAHGGRLWATRCEPRGALLQFTIPAD
jgi:PAS domain S-box-containing protein